ncbi:sugar-binding domain-containing protein [Marinifilum sp. RC60d5]|uniref:sugar-binding domain-containing protein n=1 Tax=Marinifilum sp. RC60d5 TaxID=3458414 RepID=UPI004036C036
MKRTLFLTALLIISLAFQSLKAQKREADFNFDWKFTLLDDTKIPSQIPFEDEAWREVRLPHDWSVEFSFDEKMEGCTGYLAGGVGVYQKHFKTATDKNKKSTFILFDGVYNNATFWLNGKRLGENPYGYSPVYFDLTPFLKEKGEDNVLTVHVDHSRYADSRWYTGSGIYRNVKLITVDKLHIPIWGTFVTTPQVSADEATV